MQEIHMDILSVVLVLMAAWLGGTFAKRIGYPSILGELLVGIVLGPALLGWLDMTPTIKILAEVGIILLMVYVGIEIDFRDLKKASWAGFMVALGSFAGPLIIGYFLFTSLGQPPFVSFFIAMLAGVTSIATKSRILLDLDLLNTRVAYVLMAGAMISDTIILIVFAGVVSYAQSGGFDMATMGILGLKTVVFFAATGALGYFLLPKIGSWISKSKSQSSTLLFTVILIVAFGFAELAELAGLHSILGAFMAGLFIRDNLFPKNVSKELNKAFYDVSIGFLAPVFFVTAGFSVSLQVFQTDWQLLLGVILTSIIGKTIGVTLFYLPTGHGWREGFTAGTGMNGGGAVEIIIAGIGLEMGIISQNVFSILVFMAIFTTTLVPMLIKYSTGMLRRLGQLKKITDRKGYIIVGVNPLSMLLARHLNKHSHVVMVDANRDLVSIVQEEGFDCVHGNALKEETLNEAGANVAETFLGLTGNSEINFLSAQLASESFRVPRTHVAISRSENGAGTDLLDAIKATSLFAKRTQIDKWFTRIANEKYEEKEDEITGRTTSRDWVQNRRSNSEVVLPVLIQNKEGVRRPFHFGAHIEEGERVVYLSPVP